MPRSSPIIFQAGLPLPPTPLMLPPLQFGLPQPFYPPVVYYFPGAQGWDSTFLGLPAIPWNLQMQSGGTGFGVRTNRFGFNITGSSNVLNNGATYFSDPQWTNFPGRFYRFRSE